VTESVFLTSVVRTVDLIPPSIDHIEYVSGIELLLMSHIHVHTDTLPHHSLANSLSVKIFEADNDSSSACHGDDGVSVLDVCRLDSRYHTPSIVAI
jgi:hypothetical protein